MPTNVQKTNLIDQVYQLRHAARVVAQRGHFGLVPLFDTAADRIEEQVEEIAALRDALNELLSDVGRASSLRGAIKARAALAGDSHDR